MSGHHDHDDDHGSPLEHHVLVDHDGPSVALDDWFLALSRYRQESSCSAHKVQT
jgi:hypothetical protein